MRPLAAVALLVLALAVPAGAGAPPTKSPGELVVGVSMPVAGLQVGAVRGRDVVLAKGLEIDLARALARKLGVPRVRFVHERLFSTLVSGRPSDWDLAVAAITITPERSRRVDFSVPYLTGDQAVLLREGLVPVPASIAALRGLQLCSERATTGARVIVERIKPRKRPRLVNSPSQLVYDLFHDRCDAVVYDAAVLGAQRAAAPERYGAFAGRIVTREQYGIAFPRGSALRGPVNTALRALQRDGTLGRLQQRWLSANLSQLKELK
jgi:polar amino acid transport system substrate-binding protein